jgi:hypothetical protein
VPHQYEVFYLGNTALESVDGLVTYYSVQRRHPDGRRWIDVAHFASREDAEGAMQTLVHERPAADGDLRVKHVRHEQV